MDCELDVLLQVRRASRQDAAAIGEICVASVRYAYKGICLDSHLATLSPAMMGSLWLREGHGHLVVDDRDIAVFLAIEGQRGIGFADIGPVRRESGKRVAELFAIYLDPAHIGQGWGKALFDACAAHCRALGFQSLESKVFSQNKRARGFYERQGGEPLRDSETEIDAGGALVKVITYRWEELPV